MKQSLILLGLISAILVGTVNAAYAQQCAYREALLRGLVLKYQETLAGRGMNDSTGIMIEFYRGESSFTILLTDAKNPKISCIVAAGSKWFEQKQKTPNSIQEQGA